MKPLVLFTLLCIGSCPATPNSNATPALSEVPLSEVRLLASPLNSRQDLHRSILLNHEIDRLLCDFRVTAGLPAKGKSYGGW